jgi:signal transduction histidine kinase
MEKGVANTEINESGDWVSKAITELRFMRNNSDPETEILEKYGLIKTLEHEVNLVSNNDIPKSIKVQGKPFTLNKGTEFVVFRILQELLFFIQSSGEIKQMNIDVTFTEILMTVSLKYNGIPIELNRTSEKTNEFMSIHRSTLLERATLIEGHLEIDSNTAGFTQIDLIVPKKISFL